MTMNGDFQTIDGGGYRAIARRRDRPWGHAIDVKLYWSNGVELGNIFFVCSPEFDEFELYQGMSTVQLMEIVAERLKTVVGCDVQVWQAGVGVYVRLNGPVDTYADAQAKE